MISGIIAGWVIASIAGFFVAGAILESVLPFVFGIVQFFYYLFVVFIGIIIIGSIFSIKNKRLRIVVVSILLVGLVFYGVAIFKHYREEYKVVIGLSSTQVTEDVNLRAGPSELSRVLMVLEKGEKVYIVHDSEGWTPVRYKTKSGFIDGYVYSECLLKGTVDTRSVYHYLKSLETETENELD